MKVYKTLTIGEFHKNFCEDYLISAEYGTNKHLFAVMDGCSMGNESHFAATLIGKILKKISIELLHSNENQPSEIKNDLKRILNQLFESLKKFGNLLLLEKNDLLSTLIVLLLDTKTNHGEIIIIGDGFVALDGKINEFDHNNIPDYLGYHLNEEFEDWFQMQSQRISFGGFRDLSICSDGINTFTHFQEMPENQSKIDVKEYLLLNDEFSENANMLNKKLLRLEKGFGLKHTDDLAIIRIINQEK